MKSLLEEAIDKSEIEKRMALEIIKELYNENYITREEYDRIRAENKKILQQG